MGEGGENGDSEENCNDRQNTDRNLTFNDCGSVNEDIKEPLTKSVMPAGEYIPIRVSIPLHKLSKCYRSNAKNVSGKKTVNRKLNFGADKILNLSIIDMNSSGIQNLGKDSLNSFNPLSVVSNAAENQVREVERVSTKVNETCDSTLFLSEEQKRMTKSIASAVLKMFNQNDINNTVGNMTLKDILNVYSGSFDMTSGHSLITKSENNNMKAKKAYQTPHLPLQNMSRLENNQTVVNKVSKSNGNCFIPDLEQNEKHESVSSFALSMYDKSYICNNSGVNKFNSLHHDLGSNNKQSNSSDLNSSTITNLNVEKSNENRPPPLYLGKKRFVVEPKDGVLKVIDTPDDNVLPSEEQTFGNKTISSCILRMDNKSHDNENLDGKTLVPVSLGTVSEAMTSSILSDLDNNANTSVLKTLEAETSEDTYSSSSDDSELDVYDDNLSSLTRSSSSNISEHSVSNDASLIMDYSLPRYRDTTDFQQDFDINSIQNCVSYEPIGSKQPTANFHSLYKKRVRVKTAQQEKDEQLERRRVELERERDDLKKQVSYLEMLTREYVKVAERLVPRFQATAFKTDSKQQQK